jgi:formate hydrogenlyase subunit 3/multisubunit Na+/H+ antiporter MnhD subunit
MSGYQIGLLFHLVGVILFFAGAAVAGVVAWAAPKREKPSEVAAILNLARPGAIMLAVGGLVLLIAGFYLSGKIEGYGQRWLEISIVLFVIALVVGAWGGRRSRKTREYAVALADDGAGDEATLRAMLSNRATWAMHWASVVLAVAVLVLMIWQPGA